jgi:hypothetical protein
LNRLSRDGNSRKEREYATTFAKKDKSFLLLACSSDGGAHETGASCACLQRVSKMNISEIQ